MFRRVVISLTERTLMIICSICRRRASIIRIIATSILLWSIKIKLPNAFWTSRLEAILRARNCTINMLRKPRAIARMSWSGGPRRRLWKNLWHRIQ